MRLRQILLFATYICSPSIALAQDLSRTVLPLTDFKIAIHEKGGIPPKPSLNPLSFVDVGVEAEYGTAFCVDPACRFIGTNYHVARDRRVRKIKGEEVIQRYLATRPDDDGAVVNEIAGKQMAFTPSRDLAIFELRHPLRNFHGIDFSLDDLQERQEIDIYAYPKLSAINPHRKLEQFHGRFKGLMPNGLLAFEYGISDDGKTICGGASGGIVVDKRSQQIVGILSGTGNTDERIAIAIPTQALLEFVSKVQPYLAQRLFPRHARVIPPVSADLYPQFVEPVSHVLQERPEEPPEVRTLRKRGQALADSIRNFIAVQTFAWGSEASQEPVAAAYEVRVVDGDQRFSDGQEEFKEVPLPPRLNVSFATGGEWSELPEWIGTKLNLKIHRAADSVVNGRPIKVFQYSAATEDRLCTWDTQVDYGIFTKHHVADVTVHGEVWTDDDMNPLRISEHCELPAKLKWKDYEAVVTYGWLHRADEQPQLIPVTIYADVKYKNKLYWCRGLFTNYQVFTARARIIGNWQLQ